MATSVSFAMIAAAILSLPIPAHAVDGGQAVQGPPDPGTTRFVLPDSSLEHPGDAGRRAHTNYGIAVPPPITGPGHTMPPHAPR